MITIKTKIFLAAFWLWTWILFQLSAAFNHILKIMLYWIPNNLTPTLNSISAKQPIKLIEARDGFGKIITNKLNLFLNLRWDNNMCDEKGGIDLDSFCKYVGSSVVWVVYLLEYEVDPIYQEFISNIQSDRFDMCVMHKLIKTAVIDISNKIIKKFDTSVSQTEESILFGEVNFHNG